MLHYSNSSIVELINLILIVLGQSIKRSNDIDVKSINSQLGHIICLSTNMNTEASGASVNVIYSCVMFRFSGVYRFCKFSLHPKIL
ncbi:hypothetical protein [Aquimarina sp. AU119]|uniref:hypothetical protein n=1 Tax=Aquimarina sp. AU119 TaxID=2108528 RepID=UPI0013575C56|nr:hypothetical protein [Aquimarina sp. AU119]